MQRLCCFFFLTQAIGLVGCGGAETTGVVTGAVKFKDGTPIPSGTISFRNDEGKVDSTQIKEGEYRMAKAPLGKVKITVQTFAPSPGVVPPDAKPGSVKLSSLKYEKVPEKYADFNTTDLTHTVPVGESKFDVELERPKK